MWLEKDFDPMSIDLEGSPGWLIFTRAGLVSSQRRSRSIVYRADLARFQEVPLFLIKDCCDGRPEICAP